MFVNSDRLYSLQFDHVHITTIKLEFKSFRIWNCLSKWPPLLISALLASEACVQCSYKSDEIFCLKRIPHGIKDATLIWNESLLQ